MIPEISVLVPIYNSSYQLDKCLNSIKSQTFRNIEVIMVNDGSTDNSEEICLRYQELDKRFSYYKQENKGKSVAVNFAYKKAIGEYISFIDSDDFIDVNLLEKSIETAKKYCVDIVNYNYIYIKNGEKEKKTTQFPKNQIIYQNDFRKLLEIDFRDKHMLLWFTAMNLIKKELLDKHKILHSETLKTGIDSIFNLECYLNSNGIYSIDNHFYNYVYNSESITQKKHKPKLLENITNQFKAKKNIYEKYNLNSTSFKRDFAKYYIEHSLFFLLNNEKNSENKLQSKKLREIRNSDIYNYCFKFYNKSSKGLTLKKKTTIYLFKKKHLNILCLIHKIFGDG